jgi:Zn-dependent peptidase ImmA (M78 family)
MTGTQILKGRIVMSSASKDILSTVNESDIYSILKKLAENNGIEIVYCDLSSSINGFYWDPLTIPPAIFLSKDLSGKELNHVFAHELGHSQLIDEDDGDLINCQDKAKIVKAEKQADAFAAMLIDGIMMASIAAQDKLLLVKPTKPLSIKHKGLVAACGARK